MYAAPIPIREVERRMENRPGLGYIQARNEILLERAARERAARGGRPVC